MPAERVLVVEDDRFLRVVGIVLDPGTSAERQAAYADFFAHDEPDFEGYCARLRARVGSLFPSEVRLVDTPERMRAALPGSHALVVESLADGGVRMGLDRATAMTLATQTVLGAAKLLLETGLHPGALKDMVSSPGGTTIAGIAALEEGGLRTTFIKAVERATQRSRELGQGPK